MEIIHAEQLAEHGGRAGVRDENALEAALARPRHLLAYEPQATVLQLAAALCVGLARDHPFVDGNKRVALLATYTFLALNGLELEAAESEAADTIERVAAGTLDEPTLADWLQRSTR